MIFMYALVLHQQLLLMATQLINYYGAYYHEYCMLIRGLSLAAYGRSTPPLKSESSFDKRKRDGNKRCSIFIFRPIQWGSLTEQTGKKLF